MASFGVRRGWLNPNPPMPTNHPAPTLRLPQPRKNPARAPREAIRIAPPPTLLTEATHDLLVPNPRPDLTFDPNTLRMLSVF